MATLLLRFDAPLQSWGVTPKGRDHLTQAWPSKSGIVGLLANALGRRYADPIDDLTGLKMGARVDRPGVPIEDYGTAQRIALARGSGLKTAEEFTKTYLSDGIFLVGLEGLQPLLTRLDKALRNPVRTLFLGRRSCPPCETIWLPDGLIDATLDEALATYPWIGRGPQPDQILTILESDDGDPVQDVPLNFQDRKYEYRFVRYWYITPIFPQKLEEQSKKVL